MFLLSLFVCVFNRFFLNDRFSLVKKRLNTQANKDNKNLGYF